MWNDLKWSCGMQFNMQWFSNIKNNLQNMWTLLLTHQDVTSHCFDISYKVDNSETHVLLSAYYETKMIYILNKRNKHRSVQLKRPSK